MKIKSSAQTRCDLARTLRRELSLSPRLALGLVLILVGLPSARTNLRAEIPEPDNVFWGVIALAGQPATAADTNLVIEARKTANGPVVARYRMGTTPAYGDRYSLRVPLEAFLPLSDTNSSRVGGLIYLSVRDHSGVRVSRNTSIPSRGKVTRVDFVELDTDGDGLPDGWERRYFGSDTNGDAGGDPDHDGRNNREEFLTGTNPLQADGRHPADAAPADDQLTFAELEEYTLAWLSGETWRSGPTNIPISYVTRAAYLWLNGERYSFTNSPPTNAPLWWVNTGFISPSSLGARSNNLESPLPGFLPPATALPVTVRVVPDEQVLVYAVADRIPAGWLASNISHGGSYDSTNHTVKWGPFFDSGERDLTYNATPGATSGDVTFSGVGSFDGVDWPIGPAPRRVVFGPASDTLRFVAAASGPTGPTFTLAGTPSRRYVLEVSTNLTSWLPLQTNVTDAAGRYLFRPANAAQYPRQFFRARGEQ